MPHTHEVTPSEIKGVIARVKRSLLLQAVVDLDLDLAYHRAHEQSQAEAAAATYASAGRARSAATLGESLALAGVETGSRDAEAGWAALVCAGDTESGSSPPPDPASLARSEPAPGPPRRPAGRARKSTV